MIFVFALYRGDKIDSAPPFRVKSISVGLFNAVSVDEHIAILPVRSHFDLSLYTVQTRTAVRDGNRYQVYALVSYVSYIFPLQTRMILYLNVPTRLVTTLY